MRFVLQRLQDTEEPLLTSSFIAEYIDNLLIYIAFCMLFPVLPIYLLTSCAPAPAPWEVFFLPIPLARC